MKIFDSLSSLDQIRGSPLGPMLREIVIRMLGHFEYNPVGMHQGTTGPFTARQKFRAA
jgi:hypothetical protein